MEPPARSFPALRAVARRGREPGRGGRASPDARRLFPGLDHDATLREITVVADTGEVYLGDAAWLACLWALAEHRALAYRLARPALRPVARQLVSAAAAVRELSQNSGDRQSGYGDHDDRADCTDDRCG